MLDVDILGGELVSDLSPNHDFRRAGGRCCGSRTRCPGRERRISYFGVTLPAQLLDNHATLGFISDVRFPGSVCDEGDLRGRITDRARGEARAKIDLHLQIDSQLRPATAGTPT